MPATWPCRSAGFPTVRCHSRLAARSQAEGANSQMLKSEIKPGAGIPFQHIRGNKWKPEWIEPNLGCGVSFIHLLREGCWLIERMLPSGSLNHSTCHRWASSKSRAHDLEK